jgi:mannose-6-phosphate isomerase
VDLLEPVVRPYAWGSRQAIAELQGRPVPSPGPEAELWMGAHHSAPSTVDRGGRQVPLDAVIAADPARELGRESEARFGTLLPFLLKVLAAGKALSIQVHPSRTQAQAGYWAENDRGLALDDPARNYVDDWPKPELLCALTPFEVLAGMRAPADAADLLGSLGVGQLDPIVTDLVAATGPRVLTEALGRILSWPPGQREALVADVVAACARLAAADGPYAAACRAAVRLSGEHPGDLGIVASLLMRHATLQPGEAVFMPAGGLHAYLHGTGIEVLANSDNVVRAGLTGKHIDVPELLKLTDPAVDVPVLAPRRIADGVSVYDAPVLEFRLYRLDLESGERTVPGTGPRLALCLEGDLVLRSAARGTLKVRRGESCFIAAADGVVTGAGPAVAFIASTGL